MNVIRDVLSNFVFDNNISIYCMQFSENICFVIFMMVAEHLLVVISVLCDYFSGIRKARIRGEKIMSDGIRVSVTKLAGYLNLLLGLDVIDIMQMVGFYYLDAFYGYSIPLFPLVSIFGAISEGGIEVKSIFEKAEDKTRKSLTTATTLLADALKNSSNPQAIAEKVVEFMQSDAKSQKCS